MELSLAFEVVNWYAVLAATVAVFILGGLWYAPHFFGRPGIIAANAEMFGGPPRRTDIILIVAFVMIWTQASLLAAILGPNPDLWLGINVGLLVGLFFVSTAIAFHYVFERRPFWHLLVNGGFQLVSYTIMGAIVGSWH
jgi:hypothetical protein